MRFQSLLQYESESSCGTSQVIKPVLSKENLSDLADIALSVSFCCRSNIFMTEHLPCLRLQRVIWTIVFVSVSACQAALCFTTNPLSIKDLPYSLKFISLSPQQSTYIFSVAPTLIFIVFWFQLIHKLCKFQLEAFLPGVIGNPQFHIHGCCRCHFPI